MNRLQQEGMNAIRRIDEEARDGPSELPDHVCDAIAHGAVAATSKMDMDDACFDSIFKGTLALMKNLYRTGYSNGKRDTETALNVGKG